MLRFRRDRLHIGIEADRLSLVRLKMPFAGFAAPRVIDSTTVALDPNARDENSLGALKRTLTDRRWQDADALIVLSDRLARYFIAERPAGARNTEEVRQAARLGFEDVFGEAGDAWDIQIDMPPFATRQLGCALRKSCVAGLVAACAEARVRVLSLAPFAVSEYNRWHTAIGRKPGWFAVFGSDGVWIARRSGADWDSASQYTVAGDPVEEFRRILAQESLRASCGADSATAPTIWLAGRLTDSTFRQRLLSPSRQPLGAPAWPDQSAEWSAEHRLALSSLWPRCA